MPSTSIDMFMLKKDDSVYHLSITIHAKYINAEERRIDKPVLRYTNDNFFIQLLLTLLHNDDVLSV